MTLIRLTLQKLESSTSSNGPLGLVEGFNLALHTLHFYSDLPQQQVDVYSYAILLYQLITRRVPFDDLGDHLVNSAVVRGERPEWQSNAVALLGLPTMTELMLRCWLHKPSQRPTSEQIAGLTYYCHRTICHYQ